MRDGAPGAADRGRMIELNVSYIMVCDEDRTFTSLNRFDRRANTFEGEYSLLHNTYSHDEYFLSRFLLAHVGHALQVVSSDEERYTRVWNDYRRFQEQDIPRYVEDKVLKMRDAEHALQARESVGQIQLLIAKQLIKREWESVQHESAQSDRDTFVLLGKEWAFQWSLRTIEGLGDMG